MKKNTAVLFPGQGSQRQNMADSLVKNHRCAAEVFKRCSDFLGVDVLEMTRQPEKEIARPCVTHKIIPVTSLAAWTVFNEDFTADFAAGHSLGELTALAAAGACSLEDMLELCTLRGELMESTASFAQGGMTAVIDSSMSDIAEICDNTAEAGNNRLWIANINSFNQIVIAGAKEKLSEAEKMLSSQGAKCIRLKTACAFHTPHMGPAVTKLMERAQSIIWRLPEIPVVSARTGKPYGDSGSIPYELAMQLVQPVLWLKTVQFLASAHVETAYEMTPAGTLGGLVETIEKNIKCHNI